MQNNQYYNTQNNLYSDNCYVDIQKIENEKQYKYNVNPNLLKIKNSVTSSVLEPTPFPEPFNTPQYGMYSTYNGDVDGKYVNVENKLLNGKIGNQLTSTSKKQCKVLNVRSESDPSNPLMKGHVLFDNLRILQDTSFKKSDNPTSCAEIDRFEPLIKEIQDNVQNVKHIIPTAWVNGGMSTRNIVKNIDYLKCLSKNRPGNN